MIENFINKKIRFNELLFIFTLLMPPLYLFSSIFSIGLSGKIIVFYVIFSLIGLEYNLLKNNLKFLLIVFNVFLLFYVTYDVLIQGLNYIFHMTFYSYLQMFITLILGSIFNFRKEFSSFLSKNSKFSLFCILFFYLSLFLSIIFSGGIKVSDFGTPMLYGPFSIPHITAYMLLVIFALCGVYVIRKKSLLFFIFQIIAVFLIMFTGVRSAFLSLILLIVFELFMSRFKYKKAVLIISIPMILLIFLINTDLILNSNVVQKTIFAANNGDISNGREDLKGNALLIFNNISTTKNYLFGIGMDTLTNEMYNFFGLKLHAHNDYVNLLVGYGYVGLLLELLCQLALFRKFKNKIGIIFLQVFIFILSYTNGFALYTILLTSFMIVICFFENNDNFKEENTNASL